MEAPSLHALEIMNAWAQICIIVGCQASMLRDLEKVSNREPLMACFTPRFISFLSVYNGPFARYARPSRRTGLASRKSVSSCSFCFLCVSDPSWSSHPFWLPLVLRVGCASRFCMFFAPTVAENRCENNDNHGRQNVTNEHLFPVKRASSGPSHSRGKSGANGL